MRLHARDVVRASGCRSTENPVAIMTAESATTTADSETRRVIQTGESEGSDRKPRTADSESSPETKRG